MTVNTIQKFINITEYLFTLQVVNPPMHTENDSKTHIHSISSRDVVVGEVVLPGDIICKYLET